MITELQRVKPLGRKLLVKLLPLYSGRNALGLTLVDQKKHWDHQTRKGEVLATGPKVLNVIAGDIVLFTGAAGKWIDDPQAKCYKEEAAYRSVDENELLAVFEREDDKACAVA